MTVVTPRIAENIREIYKAYKKRGWNYQQYIACLDPLGEVHGQTSFSLLPETYGQFMVDLFDLWFDDFKRGEQPFIRQFENYAALAVGYMAESCDQRGSCGIQNVVEADGSVYPCDFYMLDEYRLGNFNEDRLDAIDEKRCEIGFVERPLALDEKCKSCEYYRLCRGGCQRNRDYNGNTGLYQNYFCKGYQMFFEKCQDRILEIGKIVMNWR